MDISHLLSATLARKQLKITYRSRVEVDAYIHWAEDPVVLRFVLKKRINYEIPFEY